MARTIVAVAIDFGTYASGIAYCKHTANGLQQDDFKYRTKWEDQRYVYPKNRTAILYKGDQPMHYGWTAEKKFVNLDEGQRQRERFQFVENFKLALDEGSSQRLPSGLQVVKVISDYLRYMVDAAVKLFYNQQGEQLNSYPIVWVLTVPALWTEGQKALMRKAAYHAGMIPDEQSDQLKIILEPEAAAFHCLLNPSLLPGPANLRVGQTFMIIDAGGGTVDITMHTIKDNGAGKKVLSEATSGNAAFCGATYVDKNFEAFARQQIGDTVFNSWKLAFSEDFLTLMSNWESEKRSFDPKVGGRPPYVKLPESLKEALTESARQNLRAKSDGYTDRLQIEIQEMAALFEPQVQQIVRLAVGMLRGSKVRCNYVLLVGGFAASPYLRDRLKAELKQLVDGVVEAQKPELAVLLGAVQYGIQPDLIYSRRTRHAFGIETDDGHRKNAFMRLVPINHEVGVSHPITEDFVPTSDQHTRVTFKLFRTTNNDAKTTTEPGMELLANMVIRIPQERVRNPDNYKLRVSLTFGATELRMTATDLQTNQTLVSETQYSYSRVPEKTPEVATGFAAAPPRYQPPPPLQQQPQQQPTYVWPPVAAVPAAPGAVAATQLLPMAQPGQVQAYGAALPLGVAAQQPAAGVSPFVQMPAPLGGGVAAAPPASSGMVMPSPFAAGPGNAALPLGFAQSMQQPSPFSTPAQPNTQGAGWLQR